jgi:hypothetical protein
MTDRRKERAALELARRGYHVFPCRPHGKEPLTKNGFHDATRDEGQILRWWDRWPDANIGVACGKSGIVVVDIDAKHGADPREIIDTLSLENFPTVLTGEAPEPSAELPNSLEGVRGAHVIFRGELPTAKTTIAGVEIRGDGAYIVVPPSVHPSGVAYDGELPPVASLPLAESVGVDLIPTTGGSSVEVPEDDDVAEPGERHESLLAWTRSRYTAKGVLGRAALDGMRGHNARVNKPPLDDAEVQRLWRHLEGSRIAASEREKPQRDTVRAKREVILTPASAIRSERGRWLWRERFPLRGLTVVAGEKGLGKSLLTNAQTVAAITRGTLDGELFGTPADVLIVTAEDDWRAQVKPRLMAHGADLARVHRVEVHDADGVSLLTLPDDVAALEAKIIGLRDAGRIVAMLVVDPIGAFVSEAANTHADAPVRRILAPLAALADRQDVAVVAVMHLTKDEAKRLISRVTGAGAFVNAARSYLAMVPDPDDPEGEQGDRRLLVHVRTNWGRPAATLALHVEGRDVDTDAGERTNVGYLIVDGESSATVDDVQRGRDDDAEDAEDAIGAALAGASQPSRDVKGQVAKELGCSRKTVQRAAMRMRDRGELTVTEGGFPRTTTWTLARAQEGTERVPTEKKDGVEPNPPVPTGPSPVPTVPTGGNGALEPDSDPDNSSRDTSALSRAHARAADANGGGQAELIPRPDRTDGRGRQR